MQQDIYSLTLVPDGGGALTKAAPAPMGMTPVDIPSFVDRFRKTRAPSPAELLEEHLGTAWSCAQLNADLVACTTLRLYVQTRRRPEDQRRAKRAREWGVVKRVDRKTAERLRSSPVLSKQLAGAEEIEEVTQHPLLDLLRCPNPDEPSLSYYDLMHLISEYLDTIGRAYWYVEKDGLGLPRRLWMLAAHHVSEWSDLSSRRAIDRYDYGGGAQRQSFAPDEIVPFRFPDPADPYRGGRAPLRAVIEQVRIARKLDAHTGALLDNAGRPDAIFTPRGDETGGSIGPSEATRLELKFRQKFAYAGRGGLLVLDTPGMLSPLTWPARDIADLEQTKLTKEQICNAYGVPTTKLSRNDANLASARTGDYAHAKDAGRPRCMRIEAAINTGLVPMYDDSGRLFAAFDNPVPEDHDQLREDRKVVISMGGVSVNESREWIGLEEIEGGETRLVPGTLLPTDERGRPIPHAQQPLFGVLPQAPGAAPASSTPAPAEGGGNAQDLQVTQDAVLNGAQIQAARQIVADVAAGLIPRDAGLGQLIVLFNLTPEKAEQIMGSAGNPKVPTTPNPKPAGAEGADGGAAGAPAAATEEKPQAGPQEEEADPKAKRFLQAEGTDAVIVREQTRVEQEWVCPHCQKAIGEKELYAEGLDDPEQKARWFHRPCGKPLVLPADTLTPVWLKEPAASRKAEGPHEYSCVMADLHGDLRDEVLQLAAGIPDEDLAEDGRESTPHATVLYGLHAAEPAAIAQALAGQGPLTLTLGRVSVFEAKEPGRPDVVKLDVDSPDLHRLNQLLRELEHTATHPNYVPHVTLAYVKAGLGAKYAGGESLLGRTASIDRLVFSSRAGDKTELVLRAAGACITCPPLVKAYAGDPAATADPLPQGEALAALLRRTFAEQLVAVLDGLQQKHAGVLVTKDDDDRRGQPTPPRLPENFLPLEQWNESLSAASQPLIEMALRDGARQAIARVGASEDVFSVVDAGVPKAARELALQFAEATNQTTSLELDAARDTLRREIEEGIFQGDTRLEMRRRVQQVFEQADRGRADAIARSETSRALHTGELTTVRESGLARRKFLILSADACPLCQAVAAAGPKGLDEPFHDSGRDGPYRYALTPPLHPNCQCSEGFELGGAAEGESA